MYPQKILVDYYRGIDGKTLLIATEDDADLQTFVDAISGLVRGETACASFSTIFPETVRRTIPRALFLCVGSLSRVGVTEQEIVWSDTVLRWIDTYDLLEVLIGARGHQYVDVGDVTVELSHNE